MIRILKSIPIFLLLFMAVYINAQESLYEILPDKDYLPFEVAEETELYVGDDLFDLINGGAELYHEYGFIEVLAASIVFQDTNPLKTEIYDMGSTESAWGIFGITSSSNARAVSLGDTARKGEGFLQFIKDKYMVYMYFDQLDETKFMHAAECVAGNITQSSDMPEILKVLNIRTEKPENIIYIKGNLALSSVYNFHYKDVFGYTSGAVSIYPDLKVILLNYDDTKNCMDNYSAAENFFLESHKYHDLQSFQGSFNMLDKKDRHIECYFENTFLVIFINTGESDNNELLTDIVKRMEESGL